MRVFLGLRVSSRDFHHFIDYNDISIYIIMFYIRQLIKKKTRKESDDTLRLTTMIKFIMIWSNSFFTNRNNKNMYLSYFFFHYIVIINSIMQSFIHVIYKHPFIKRCIHNYIIYTCIYAWTVFTLLLMENTCNVCCPIQLIICLFT